MATSAEPEQIEQWLRAIVVAGSVLELRCTRSKVSGYYTDLKKLAQDAYEYSELGDAVYFTINPCQDDLLGRYANQLTPGEATSDRDILRRARLLLDFDPRRPAECSSTDEEKATAWDLVCQVTTALEADGWPAPTIVDSGNGYHCHYAIDLPAADGGLVAGFLKGISERFSTPAVDIDTKVGNASRICKVPGTIASKGENTDERPHRTSFLISASDMQVVPREKLEAWRPSPSPAKGNLEKYGLNFEAPTQVSGDRESVLRRAREYLQAIPVAVSGQGGSTVTLTAAAKIRIGFDLTHQETFECLQDWNARCEPPWTPEDLMRKVTESKGANDGHLLVDRKAEAAIPVTEGEAPKRKLPTRINAADLVEECPEPLPAVLDGILRQGELLGIVSGSKVGKSWLCMSLAIAMLHGTEWMGKFQTRQGKVLLIDTEVQKQTLSHRWQKVCRAHKVEWKLERGLEMVPLREHPTDMETLCRNLLADIQPMEFELIIIDSFYKLFGEKQDENSNACVGRMLSDLQAVASRLGIAIAIVHHTSKGGQGGKAVTDTGAGAGAFWRCVDSGIAIRQHEEDEIFVVDGVVRSFKALQPFCVRQEFPLWLIAEDLDPKDLKQDSRGGRQRAAATPKASDWTLPKFIDCMPTTPVKWGEIEASMEARGCKSFRAKQLRKQALDSAMLFESPPGHFSTVKESAFLSNVRQSREGQDDSPIGKRSRIMQSLRDHPEWTLEKHSESCDCSIGYVSRIKAEM